MLVNRSGDAVTQRECPKLARVRVENYKDCLHIEAPGRELIVVYPPSGARCITRIWGKEVEVIDGGADSARWFSEFSGLNLRLVYMPDSTMRPVDKRYDIGENHVSCADGFPILITSEASLADLNNRLSEPVPMSRFRPNLVFSGDLHPFDEDAWQTIRIGDVILALVKPCGRCVVTTTDQATGAVSREPLRTLATYRAVRRKVCFGQNALLASEPGVIRVGDRVHVLGR